MPYRQFLLVMYYVWNITIFTVNIITYFYLILKLFICLCLLCSVVCKHNFHSACIFIVCNRMKYVG